jgi:hypothetical protein
MYEMANPQEYGPPPGSQPGQVLVTVGDIACTQTEVLLPTGRAPLRGTTWMVTNQVTVTEGIPTWAIVLAIIGIIACLLGLFFLLVKEKKVQGFMQVSVQGPGLYYATQLPVSNEMQMRDIESRVNYIRTLVAALG